MADRTVVESAADPPVSKSSFEAAAEEHLKSLAETGESPDEIAGQLSAVAESYAADGLNDEAETLRVLVHRYRLNWLARRAGRSHA